MDEPLASLDLPRKRELLPYLERLAQDVNTPILYVSHSMDEILRLADQVVVMDAGKVRAVGGLEEVWASSALRPWLQREEPSSILRVKVIGHHDRYAMTALALGDQRLWVGKLAAQEGDLMRIRINAADVSLVLQPPQNSSIRNILPVKITECLEVDGQVDVKLAIGEQWLWARITPWARDELGLKPGQWVYAQIKSVSFNRKN